MVLKFVKIQVRSMLDDVRSVNKINAAPDRTGTARLLDLLALVTRFEKKLFINPYAVGKDSDSSIFQFFLST